MWGIRQLGQASLQVIPVANHKGYSPPLNISSMGHRNADQRDDYCTQQVREKC
jgi:hypothetical protein